MDRTKRRSSGSGRTRGEGGPDMNRREFLQSSALGAAALTLPWLSRRPAASERITLGVIGFGTIGRTVINFMADPRVQVVAVADPVTDLPNYGYDGQLRGGRLVGRQIIEAYYSEQAPAGSFRGCRVYEDFRDMLSREDIDAVYIATPDHWHCAAALFAAGKGKHIYGQKPLAVTVEEGRRIAEAVKKSGITWQTGSQQRSLIYFRTACEFIRNGRIGRLQGIKVGLPGGHRDFSQLASRNRPETPPSELNYDLWLGPVPERPYIPALLQLNWRHNWDFGGGFITDWGAHNLDIVQWALDMDNSGPVSIENINAPLPPQTDVYNTPKDFDFDVVYANGVRVNVSNRRPNGITFEGEDGKSIFVSRWELKTVPAELRRQKIRKDEIRLYESKSHEQNFVDCIYEGRPVIAPAEVGHRSITICHLANIAIRLGRSKLRWDPASERVVDDAAAQAMLSRPMRKGYCLI